MSEKAVLLLAYGAADSLAEIPEYLKDILGGRPVPDNLIVEVTHRYKEIGGNSPLKEITAAQASGLESRLGGWPVFVGMRHSQPRIIDAVRRIRDRGIEEIVAAPLTPYDSKLSVGAYLAKLDEAIAATGRPLKLRPVRGWNEHPRLIDAFAARIEEADERMDANAVLLLTAHSLPEKIRLEGDPYPGAFERTAALVHERTRFGRMEFAYQSAGAAARGPWLGPDAGAVLEKLAAEGVRSVLLSPIGFVSEHMETLYDDDVLYKKKAESLGLSYARAKALNDHPGFLDALAEAVLGA